jgi:hypothetical protein
MVIIPVKMSSLITKLRHLQSLHNVHIDSRMETLELLFAGEIGKDEVQRMTTGNICVKRYKEVKIMLESYGIPGNFRKKHGGVFMKKLKI